MKKIATLICLFAFQCIALSQTLNTSATNGGSLNSANPLSCSLVYSEDNEMMVFQDSLRARCREMSIVSLPPLTQSLTPLHIVFTAKGSYTFKKDEALELPEGKDVYLEDMLTGMTFDLRNSSAFSFSVNRHIPDRFILHIEKPNTRPLLSARDRKSVV